MDSDSGPFLLGGQRGLHCGRLQKVVGSTSGNGEEGELTQGAVPGEGVWPRVSRNWFVQDVALGRFKSHLRQAENDSCCWAARGGPLRAAMIVNGHLTSSGWALLKQPTYYLKSLGYCRNHLLYTVEPLYCGHLGDLVKERFPHFRDKSILKKLYLGQQSVLITEVSLFQGCPLRGVPL